MPSVCVATSSTKVGSVSCTTSSSAKDDSLTKASSIAKASSVCVATSSTKVGSVSCTTSSSAKAGSLTKASFIAKASSVCVATSSVKTDSVSCTTSSSAKAGSLTKVSFIAKASSVCVATSSVKTGSVSCTTSFSAKAGSLTKVSSIANASSVCVATSSVKVGSVSCTTSSSAKTGLSPSKKVVSIGKIGSESSSVEAKKLSSRGGRPISSAKISESSILLGESEFGVSSITGIPSISIGVSSTKEIESSKSSIEKNESLLFVIGDTSTVFSPCILFADCAEVMLSNSSSEKRDTLKSSSLSSISGVESWIISSSSRFTLISY